MGIIVSAYLCSWTTSRCRYRCKYVCSTAHGPAPSRSLVGASQPTAERRETDREREREEERGKRERKPTVQQCMMSCVRRGLFAESIIVVLGRKHSSTDQRSQKYVRCSPCYDMPQRTMPCCIVHSSSEGSGQVGKRGARIWPSGVWIDNCRISPSWPPCWACVVHGYIA